MKYPTISYLEARNPNTNEVLDTLYIGECDYNTKKFCLNYFTNPQNMGPASLVDQSVNKNYKTAVSFAEMETYHITKLKLAIQDFEPKTMEEDSALYDMKLVVYWVDEKKQAAQQSPLQFVFVTYQAILENFEY